MQPRGPTQKSAMENTNGASQRAVNVDVHYQDILKKNELLITSKKTAARELLSSLYKRKYVRSVQSLYNSELLFPVESCHRT